MKFVNNYKSEHFQKGCQYHWHDFYYSPSFVAQVSCEKSCVGQLIQKQRHFRHNLDSYITTPSATPQTSKSYISQEEESHWDSVAHH